MSTAPRDVARGFYESYNERDLASSWDRYIARDLINHAMGGGYDRDSWLGADEEFSAAFPDLLTEVLAQVAEGDVVATRWRMTGTQAKDVFGVPSTGARGTLTGTSFDRIVDGKIAEHWVDVDVGSFLQALASPTT